MFSSWQNSAIKDVWYNGATTKKNKGIYFDNYEILKNLYTNYEYDFESLSNPQFDNIFLICDSNYKMEYEQSSNERKENELFELSDLFSFLTGNVEIISRKQGWSDTDLFEKNDYFKTEFIYKNHQIMSYSNKMRILNMILFQKIHMIINY